MVASSSVSIMASDNGYDQFKYLEDSIPARWQYGARYGDGDMDNDHWWTIFGDTTLNSLIEKGLDNNYNILMAAKRIKTAQYTMRQAQSAYYPQFNLNAGWSRSRTSGMGGNEPGMASTGSAFDLGLSMSWQIDIFGKITSDVRSKDYATKATRAEYEGVRLSVAASIAQDYFQLRVWQAEWEVAREHTENQLGIVNMTKSRMDAGIGNALEVAQAQEVYYNTKASIPVLENSIHTAINSLAILVGEYPSELYPVLSTITPLPDYHQLVPTGFPAELLRRRPDVVEAEMTLKSLASSLGVAQKDFLPTLSINGSVGTTAHRGNDLFTNQSFGYTVAPTLTWNVFDGLQRKYNVAQARENYRIQIDNYNQTVMTAVQEVDNAMATYLASLRHIEALGFVLEQSDKSLELSVDLYRASLTQFSNVVDAQMSVLENQNSLIVAQGKALSALVDLCQALGGGWNGMLN